MPALDQSPDFEDVNPKDGVVDVRSTWNDVQKHHSTAGVGTEPLQYEEAQVQTTSLDDKGVQTDENAQGPAPTQASLQGLPGFLSRTEPLVSSELVKAVEEAEILEPLTRLSANASQEPATCLHFLTAFPQTLSAPAITSSNGNGNTNGEDGMLGPALGGGGAGGGLVTGLGPGAVRAAPSGAGGAAQLVVTSLSWSATGQTIAASYGRFDVAGWCELPGLLATWNIGKGEVSTTRPDAKVEVDNCLMCCSFHPAHPALIAGGTFTGEVYIWDMSREGDPQVGRSDALLDVRHTEPVVSLAWQYNITDANKYGTRSHAYRLITLGGDGRVMVWQWHKMGAPLYGYQLLHPQPGSDRKVVWGGTAMSFQRDPRGGAAAAIAGAAGAAGAKGGAKAGGKGSAAAGKDSPFSATPEAANTFMVASEGGRLFRCYHDVSDMASADWQKAVNAGDKVELRSPIKDSTYVPHSGASFGIDCSPFLRELFLSCGADGSVRIYSAVRGAPLLTAEPTPGYLYSVQWSPFRPLVFATAAADGCVYIYDLAQAGAGGNAGQQGLGAAGQKAGGSDAAGGGGVMLRPCVTLDTNGMRQPATALAFNARKPDLIATADVTGIQIWKLPSALTGARRGEEAVLRRMAAAEDAGEALRSALLR